MTMKKYVAVAAAVLSLASCGEKQFHVEGNITNATDSVLYFEHVGISEITALDSVRLGADGAFSFAGKPAEAPEFYRLRIADQLINVSIDSTETVSVRAEYPSMASRYEVSGSDNCQKIKELALKQLDLQRRALAVGQSSNLTVDESNDSILKMIDQYKDDVKRNYIFAAPNKAYAYFALFQTLGDWLLFNPRTSRDDIKAFAAVATSWDTYYPNAERGRNLHNIAIEGMKNVRNADAVQAKAIDASKVEATGLIDIALPDNRGSVRHLKDLKGRVVLLDFHMFGLQDSPARVLMLRELYNKYHDRGLEIYQVGLDPDEHFWKQQTAALPWVSVYEADPANSATFTLYNVQSIPEFFLIDRGNNVVGRSQTIKNLDSAIQQLL